MISMDKKYRNAFGTVRVICIDAPGEQPIVGIDYDGCVERWDADGSYISGRKSVNDLIEYHETDIRTIWVNVYEGWTSSYDTEVSAKNNVASEAIAIAQPVTFEVKK